jgi:excinuclease UvrABC nuclease subunit
MTKQEIFILKNSTIFHNLVSPPSSNIRSEAMLVLEKLDKCCGLYFLYDGNLKLMYIGRSYNLRNRIPTSANDKKLNYFKYLILENKADCLCLEVAFIIQLKPPLNNEFSVESSLTFKIDFNIEEPKMEEIKLYKRNPPKKRRKKTIVT